MEPQIFTYRSFLDIEHYIIPCFQRRLDHNVSREIYHHIRQQRELKKFPYLGCIDVVKYGRDFYIIDGQHRFHAYKMDYELNELDTIINVMIYYVNSYEEMVKIFELRNMGVNVPKYIICCYNDKERELMILIEEFLEKKQGFIKRQARRPNIDITEFMNEIFKYDILSEFRIRNIHDFIDFFNIQNEKIKQECNDITFLRRNKISDTMLEKSISIDLFLSLPQKKLWFDF